MDCLRSMMIAREWCSEDIIEMVRDTLRWLRVVSWRDIMMRRV